MRRALTTIFVIAIAGILIYAITYSSDHGATQQISQQGSTERGVLKSSKATESVTWSASRAASDTDRLPSSRPPKVLFKISNEREARDADNAWCNSRVLGKRLQPNAGMPDHVKSAYRSLFSRLLASGDARERAFGQILGILAPQGSEYAADPRELVELADISNDNVLYSWAIQFGCQGNRKCTQGLVERWTQMDPLNLAPVALSDWESIRKYSGSYEERIGRLQELNFYSTQLFSFVNKLPLSDEPGAFALEGHLIREKLKNYMSAAPSRSIQKGCGRLNVDTEPQLARICNGIAEGFLKHKESLLKASDFEAVGRLLKEPGNPITEYAQNAASAAFSQNARLRAGINRLEEMSCAEQSQFLPTLDEYANSSFSRY